MSMGVFGVIAMGLGGVSLVASTGFVIYVLVSLSLFRTAAAFNLAGTTILSANVFLLFYVLRAARRFGPGPLLRAVSPPSAGFWLAGLAVYCVAAAIFFPRLMAGITETISIYRSPDGQTSLELRPLEFNMLYITQLVYFLGGVAAFVSTFALVRLPGGYRHLGRALVLLFLLHILVALVDLGTFMTGTGKLLGFMRDANYAMLVDSEKGGFKRITGSFSEASAFACFTLVLLAIASSLWLDRVQPRLTAVLTAALFVLLVLSTSGTAYVGLAVYCGFLVLYEAVGPLAGRRIRRPSALLALAGLGVFVVLAVPIVAPGLAAGVMEFLDEMLFGKLDSASGRERLMWNQIAFQNFLDSYGLGVGVGGARASSFILVLLSNVGWPGLFLFFLFVASLLARPPHRSLDAAERKLVTAMRSGIVGSIVAESIVGAVFDIGLLFYVLAGATAAASFAKYGAASVAEPALPARAPPGLPSFASAEVAT